MNDESPKTPFTSTEQQELADQMAKEGITEIVAIAGSRAEESDLFPEGTIPPQNEMGADKGTEGEAVIGEEEK